MENKTYIDIENVTVGKLKAAIGATELLGQDIPTNDKTPIWDGHIFVYAKPGRRAEDLIRKVPVQVKGHVESSPGKEMISHGIRVSDLKNFARESGVLFIKICVDEEGKNEAYYCGALLKGDIKEILANTRKGVKNKTVWLNRFSVEKAALENFLTGFANAMNENPDGRWEDIAANTPYGVLAADPLPDVVRPMELYRYDSGSVRFVGRDKEMQEIEKFLVSPLPFSWWGIAAPGGAGKSRLAYELKKKLDEEDVWETVLMDRDKMAELPELSSGEFNEKYPGPTLLIVDYAQRYADTLSGWMTRIAENGFGRDQRLRMLLLDRANGETEADAPAWEEEILKSNDGAEYTLLPCRYGETMLLPRLEDEYLVQIMTDFALRLSERIGGEAELGEDKARELLANLNTKYDGQLKRPLFAMMSADLFMHGEWSEADWSLEKLLDMPVKRELNLLDGRLGAPSPAVKNAFRDVWRAATVVSSMWDPSIERMKELCPESMERIEKAEEEAGLPEGGLLLRAGLTDADCEDISGMTPDLFGEYMLFDWLREKEHRGPRAAEVGRFYKAVLEGIEVYSALEFFKRLLKDFGPMMAEDDTLRKRVFPEQPKLDDEHTARYARLLRRLFDEPNRIALRLLPAKSLIALAGSREGETSEDARIFNDAGSVCKDLGQHGLALGFFEKAAAASEQANGADSQETAASYNNIATVYDDMGDYDSALEYHKKSIEIKEKVLGTDHPSTAASYNNIAQVYRAMGDYDSALEYYNKALQIVKKALGPEHPNTAATYNNIANVYQAMGDYDSAIEYMKKNLAISEKVLGTDHPSTAASYNNIAALYHAMGDYDSAIKYMKKALAIMEKVLGPDHPNTATMYNNIAQVYQAMGDYDSAIEYMKKDLSISEKVLGTDHPSTAIAYNNIGGLYLEQGKPKEALPLFEKALNVFDAKLGPEHPYTVGARRAKEYVEMLLQIPPELREMLMQLSKLPEEEQAALLASLAGPAEEDDPDENSDSSDE